MEKEKVDIAWKYCSELLGEVDKINAKLLSQLAFYQVLWFVVALYVGYMWGSK